MESGTHHLVTVVVHAPNKIGVGLAIESGCISQCRQVLADLLRVGIVVFEFNPLRFIGQVAQLMDEAG